MGNQVNSSISHILACITLGFFICSPVCAIHIVVFEDSDRTTPIHGALIYRDGSYVSITDVNGTYNLTYDGQPPRIRVTKAGYHEWTGIPAPNDTLILVPLQVRNCTFIVHVFDADTLLPVEGARVRIGLGDAPVREDHTGPNGTVTLQLRAEQVYDITITSRYYEEIREKLITGFEDADVQYSILKRDRISILAKDSHDGRFIPDAEIGIGNKPIGRTNENGILITNLTRGEDYTIEAVVSGYEKAVVQVTPDDDDQIIELLLIRQKSPAFISVFDREKKPVEGARIRIDDNETGSTNRYGRLTIPDLEAREYRVTVYKTGYITQSRFISFNPADPDIVFEISPIPVMISLQVQDPAGHPLINASVRVNESDYGKTDAVGVANISMDVGGAYLVSAGMPGYTGNNTTIIPPVYSPVLLILHPDSEAAGEIPKDLIIIVSLVIVAAGIVTFYVLSRKKLSRSQKKRLSLKKRSL